MCKAEYISLLTNLIKLYIGCAQDLSDIANNTKAGFSEYGLSSVNSFA
jgi:hypothetical protein